MKERERFKHELALALHMTVAQLSRSMTEREFVRWAVYRSRYMMPTRRLEYGLAMIALKISQFAGSKTATLADFLLDNKEPKQAPDPIVKALTTGKVFRLGQKRKKV